MRRVGDSWWGEEGRVPSWWDEEGRGPRAGGMKSIRDLAGVVRRVYGT